MTYEYDEIITAKDILAGKVNEKDVIGKKGWLLDCIPQDMSLNVIGRIGQYCCLDKIDLDSDFPFESDLRPYTYFLPEKEESAPEYIPFDLSREEDRQFLRGKWIKSEEREAMITAFHTLPDGEWTADCCDFSNSTADGLLKLYTFLDGTPCGKRRNHDA